MLAMLRSADGRSLATQFMVVRRYCPWRTYSYFCRRWRAWTDRDTPTKSVVCLVCPPQGCG